MLEDLIRNMDTTQWPYWATGVTLALAVGWLLGHWRAQREIIRLREENVRLNTRMEIQQVSMQEKLHILEDARQQLETSFRSLAGDALKSNSNEFLHLAETRFNTLRAHASGELAKREKAVESLVLPIHEVLKKTDQQIQQMEKERQQAFGSLNRHLEFMALAQDQLHNETRKLVKALRRPEVRGQWGELTLKRLAELAGMVEHCDFYQQETVTTDQGKQRPDMIVRMPGDREIIVDAKAPMDAYLEAVEATDDSQRNRQLQRHARNLRARTRELANKNYWQNLRNSPDFVILFVPGDQLLSAALEYDPGLLEDALAAKVILSTPSSLVALLRSVAYGWRQEALSKNAERILDVGQDLYERLCTFAEHLEKLGSSLGRSVDSYNCAVGSFDSRVLPGVKKFTEMGIQGKKEVPEPDPVEVLPRPVQNVPVASSNDS
jgi:DNA recombination protein RmuC